MHFSSVQAGELCTRYLAEQSTSGTCGKRSLVLNGGSGRSKMFTSRNLPFITSFCSSLEQVMSVQAKESWRRRDRNRINLA